MSKSINAMSLDEVLDAIAEAKGWWRGCVGTTAGCWLHTKMTLGNLRDHPVPPTLDAIAGCMPEGYYPHVEQDHREPHLWLAYAIHFCAIVAIEDCNTLPTGDTRILAEARMVLSCWRHKAATKSHGGGGGGA